MIKDISVRMAKDEDFPQVITKVTALLRELSGNENREISNASETYATLLQNPAQGGILVAEAEGGEIVGILTYGFGYALRTGGKHGVIQELWIDPSCRGQQIGTSLLEELFTKLRGICDRVEVGMPGESYSGTPRTTNFYKTAGFVEIGMRAFKNLRS